MRRGSRALALIASLAVCVGGATGCGTGDSGGGGEDAATIKVGASLSLTGDFAPDSELVRDGYEMWAHAVNAKGGIDVGGERREVELIIRDDGSNREQAVRLVESLITQDGAEFILAPWGSGNTSAVAPITERYQTVTIAPLAASDDIWEQGYEWLFGILPRGSTAYWPVLEMAKQQGVEKVAVVSTNDVFPLLGADGAAKKAKELGMELVARITYPPGTVDVGSVITRLEGKDPHLIINTADTHDAIVFVRQLRQRGYMPRILAMSGSVVLPEFRDALGQGADGLFGFTYWSKSLPYEDRLFGTAEEFAREFKAKFGYEPTHDAVAAATAGYVLQRAIEKAGSTEPANVRDALATFDEETVFGPVHFDEAGVNDAIPSYVVQVQGEDTPIVFPDDVAEKKPRIRTATAP